MAYYDLTGERVGHPNITDSKRAVLRAYGGVTTTDYDDKVNFAFTGYLALAATKSYISTWDIGGAGGVHMDGSFVFYAGGSQSSTDWGAFITGSSGAEYTWHVTIPPSYPFTASINVPKAHSAQTVTALLASTGYVNYTYAYMGQSAAQVQVTIPAKTSYTVSYNLNGGSGTAPSAQTKWYGETLTLSSTTPYRQGYTFRGWAATASARQATWAAGGSYTDNNGCTLYAVWHQNPTCTYEVTSSAPYYNGKPSYTVRIKSSSIYDIDLGASLSSIKLHFDKQSKGISTTTGTISVTPASAGDIQPFLIITDNWGASSGYYLSTVTVKSYTAPSLTLDAERVASSGAPSEEETGSNAATSGLITVVCNVPSRDAYPLSGAPTVTVSGNESHTVTWFSNRNATTKEVSGTVNWGSVQNGTIVYAKIDNCALFTSYTISITPRDSRSSGATKTAVVPQLFYTIDFLAGGHGIAFGQPSINEGFYCNMDTNLMKETYLYINPYPEADSVEDGILTNLNNLDWDDCLINN